MNQINHPIQPAAFLAGAIALMPLTRLSRHSAIQPQPTVPSLRLPAGKEPQ